MNMPPPPAPKHAANVHVVSPRFSIKKLFGYDLPLASDYVPAWVRVLRDCGYPDTVVVLDFETYFDDEFKITSMSNPEYVQDKRFEVLGLAFLRMDAHLPFAEYEARSQWVDGEPRVDLLLRYFQQEYGPNLERCIVSFQNAPFDATILARRYGIWPKYVIDTKSLAIAWNTRTKNDLGSQTVRWGLPLKSKDETKTFSGCTNRKGRYIKSKGRKKAPPTPRPLMDAETGERLGKYALNDVNRQWELFTILLPRLSNPAVELRIQQHTLELCTKPVLRCDFTKGESLIVGMTQAMHYARHPTGLTHEEISGDKSFEWALCERLTALGENPQRYYKVGKKKMLLAIAKDDPERKLLAEHQDETIRNLMVARAALDSWPLHIKRVQRIMDMAKAWGGLMPIPLNYWGAHTGRWSGAWGINLQNLPKYGHELVLAVRNLLIAPEGHTLAIVDLAGIEARVLPWIAGQWDLVDKFANNEEIYCGFAAKVLGVPVRKPIKEGKPGYIAAVEARHTWARNSIGKIGILGCGYGMGAKEPGDETKPNYYFAAAGLDLGMASRIVSVYRETNAQITGFWRAIEKAFIYTAKYRRPCVMDRGLRFDSNPEVDVVITLPNGRELHYHKVRLTPDKRGDKAAVYHETEHRWEFLWGGTLTENVVQAMSRDILIEAGLRLEDRGYHTAHHVHDELVLCVPEGKGPECLNAAIQELSKTPMWADRLPLGAEGALSPYYRKL